MKKKILALSLVFGMLALILGAGTMAYFTDKTEVVSNTFTIGKVDIDLTEAEDWSDPETHVFVPGASFDKTPTITVKHDSNDAYVFAQIELNNILDYYQAGSNWASHANVTFNPQNIVELLSYIIEGFEVNEWEIVATQLGDNLQSATVTIAYKEKLSAGESVEIFNKVKMPADVKKEDFITGYVQELDGNRYPIYAEFADSYIKVTAAAIQADGFESYVDAGNALAEQWGVSF